MPGSAPNYGAKQLAVTSCKHRAACVSGPTPPCVLNGNHLPVLAESPLRVAVLSLDLPSSVLEEEVVGGCNPSDVQGSHPHKHLLT